MVSNLLEQACSRLLSQARESRDHSTTWITMFMERWNKFYDDQISMLTSMLAYLDRAYLLPNGQPSIREQALEQARKIVFSVPNIILQIEQGIKDWAEIERETAARAASGTGDLSKPESDRHPFITLVKALDMLGYYEEFFEQPYLDHTREFYATRSQKLFEVLKKSPQEFLEQWSLLSQTEAERAKAILLSDSWARAEHVAEVAFIQDRKKWLAQDGLHELFAMREHKSDDAVSSLRNLHDIFQRTGGLDELKDEWSAHLRSEVTKAATGEPAGVVESLLELHAFATRVVAEAFREHSGAGEALRRGAFNHAMDDAFEQGFKAAGTRTAEQLAKYIDVRLKSSNTKISEAERDALLNRVLSLFRYTHDKDVFRTFYTRALAKRLLKGSTKDSDAEKRVLQKLMKEHDPDFEKGLEMFKDLELSKDLLDAFRDKHHADQGHGLGDLSKMNAMVLQQSAWPITGTQTIQLPVRMQQAVTKFETYYKSQHHNRAVTWHHEQGTAVVEARFPSKKVPYQLSVSLFQAIILNLFNDSPRRAYQEIVEETKLEDDELKRALNSLCHKQHHILTKTAKDITADTVFSINDDFSHPVIRINVVQILAPAQEAVEDKRAHEEVDGFRQMALDSAIIRHMKQHKKSQHNRLEMAVMEAMLRFKPTPDMIKKRIDYLIESEFIERDPDDRKLYKYLA
ncbi:Cullin-domain-containing protein [Auriculariales sp. MPI-PUGE-AT-0066]|nr:Cullin-domain-containing protein [Auriculariales sp. MPI-PUGE-AT-0066]